VNEHVTAPFPRSPARLDASLGGPDADQASWARLIRQARCADSEVDADQWFPVSADAETARREAADAIAVCQACPVRSLCMALSLRHWDIGQHGIWGGLVAADRASLRQQLLTHTATSLWYSRDAGGALGGGRAVPSGVACGRD
jgi:hypothetical protein